MNKRKPKKVAKPVAPKMRTRRVTDPDAMASIIAKGKYRPHLPHHEKDSAGLMVEVRDDLVRETEGDAK